MNAPESDTDVVKVQRRATTPIAGAIAGWDDGGPVD
jgi:hypothetical protein